MGYCRLVRKQLTTVCHRPRCADRGRSQQEVKVQLLRKDSDGSHASKKGQYTILQHCAIFGDLPRVVRWFEVGKTERFAQYTATVGIYIKEPRQRILKYVMMHPHDLR